MALCTEVSRLVGTMIQHMHTCFSRKSTRSFLLCACVNNNIVNQPVNVYNNWNTYTHKSLIVIHHSTVISQRNSSIICAFVFAFIFFVLVTVTLILMVVSYFMYHRPSTQKSKIVPSKIILYARYLTTCPSSRSQHS